MTPTTTPRANAYLVTTHPARRKSPRTIRATRRRCCARGAAQATRGSSGPGPPCPLHSPSAPGRRARPPRAGPVWCCVLLGGGDCWVGGSEARRDPIPHPPATTSRNQTDRPLAPPKNKHTKHKQHRLNERRRGINEGTDLGEVDVGELRPERRERGALVAGVQACFVCVVVVCVGCVKMRGQCKT